MAEIFLMAQSLDADPKSEAIFYIRGLFVIWSLKKGWTFLNNRVPMATNQAAINRPYIFGCSIHKP